jgi:hypothetical protein
LKWKNKNQWPRRSYITFLGGAVATAGPRTTREQSKQQLIKQGKIAIPLTHNQHSIHALSVCRAKTLTNELLHCTCCDTRTSGGALFLGNNLPTRALPHASRRGRISINNENANNWGCESLFCSVRKESRRPEHSQLFAASIATGMR